MICWCLQLGCSNFIIQKNLFSSLHLRTKKARIVFFPAYVLGTKTDLWFLFLTYKKFHLACVFIGYCNEEILIFYCK